jgi:hypothetical protein
MRNYARKSPSVQWSLSQNSYRFEGGKIASFAAYGAADKVSAGIFSDLTIDLAPVFAEQKTHKSA